MKKSIIFLIIFSVYASSNLCAAQNTYQDELAHFLKRYNVVQPIQKASQSTLKTANALVGNAMRFLGIPYRYGGTTAKSGFDCSGLVVASFKKTLGKLLPRRAADQAAVSKKIAKAELRPGDLVFFNTMRRAFSHVGIYVGDGKFIHSPRTGSTVRIDSLDGSYWQKHFNGARRVIHNNENTTPIKKEEVKKAEKSDNVSSKIAPSNNKEVSVKELVKNSSTKAKVDSSNDEINVANPLENNDASEKVTSSNEKKVIKELAELNT